MHISLGSSVFQPFASSCACVKYNPGLCSPFIHYVVSNDSASGQSPDQTMQMCNWSGPSLSAYTRRHVFAWRGPFIWYLNFQTTIFLGSPKFYWYKYRNTGASIKFISPSTIFCHGYDYIHVIVICYLGPVLRIWMLREKQKVDLFAFECTVPLELSVC